MRIPVRAISIVSIVAALSVAVNAPVELLAQDEPIRVMVEAVGDQSLEVETYINNSLGTLPDVEMVEEDPQVYVHVMARRLVTNRGKRLGYVLSSASSEILRFTVANGEFYTCSDYSGLWMEVGPDLRGLCDQCVEAIDKGVLSRFRSVPGEPLREQPSPENP